jgi:1,4-alpha-glucan branching enzyme
MVYLTLANDVVHDLRPDAITIAEEVSGMPGLTLPVEAGGVGFDYRFSMGVPDYWVALTKDMPDAHWPMGRLWHELTNRRPEDRSISYAESHDQALVGDQTLMFRLAGDAIYDHMGIGDPDRSVDRAMALHKVIRLITLATAGSGYLNFMGNEFGHPEWIDFPRPGNRWSYHYARRQWRLVDDPGLKYALLAHFDRCMIRLFAANNLLSCDTLHLLWLHEEDKLLAFERAGWVFIFNFHPVRTFRDHGITVPQGPFVEALNSDDPSFGGHGRLSAKQVVACLADGTNPWGFRLQIDLPSRTGIVLQPLTGCRSTTA